MKTVKVLQKRATTKRRSRSVLTLPELATTELNLTLASCKVNIISSRVPAGRGHPGDGEVPGAHLARLPRPAEEEEQAVRSADSGKRGQGSARGDSGKEGAAETGTVFAECV